MSSDLAAFNDYEHEFQQLTNQVCYGYDYLFIFWIESLKENVVNKDALFYLPQHFFRTRLLNSYENNEN